MTHVFKTSLAGNGGMYTWKEIDENGNEVRQSEQMFASEADAEKAIRTVANSSDIVEVVNVKNINTDANTNVNLVKGKAVRDENFGMNAVVHSVEDKTQPVGQVKVEEHANVEKTKAMPAYKPVPVVEDKTSKKVTDKAVADEKKVEKKSK